MNDTYRKGFKNGSKTNRLFKSRKKLNLVNYFTPKTYFSPNSLNLYIFEIISKHSDSIPGTDPTVKRGRQRYSVY